MSASLSDKKVSTTVYLTREQELKLKILRLYTKVPTAERIRQAVDMLLDEYKDVVEGDAPKAQESSPSEDRVDALDPVGS